MIIVLTAIIIALDQISKYLAIEHLKGFHSKVIIPGFFRLTYVENYGAAFGILQNKRWIFIIITLGIIILMTGFIIKNNSSMNNLLKISLGLFLGGAIGNFIDRLRFGYVVDFLSFRLFNRYEFPVFNLADISIVLGSIIILLFILLEEEKL